MRPFNKVLTCLLAAILGLAGAGSAAGQLRPDLPPKPKPLVPEVPTSPQPAPPQPPASLPAQTQPAAPPAGPTLNADEIAASRRAAAARARAARARAAEARARAARLRAQRVKAAREAARNTLIAASSGLAALPQGLFSAPETAASAAAVNLLFVFLGAAVLLLGLASIPARAVPWYWAARTLVDRRSELTSFGALGFFAAVVFLLTK